MNAFDISVQAQAAFKRGDYHRAEQLWIQVLARVNEPAAHCNYQLGYVKVLIAQRRYREAKALLDEIFDITQDARCLHQLGQIALLEEQLEAAKMHFLAEQERLAPDAYTSRATNACSLSALLLRQDRLSSAKEYAELAADLANKAQDSGLLAWATQLLRAATASPQSSLSERFDQELQATFSTDAPEVHQEQERKPELSP